MASIRSGIGENMKDRYLFKAKHFGEWHIGNIVKEPDGLYIRDIKGNAMAYIDDESTICQCTGLKDKNGKLIWENDVVRVTINSGSTICRCAFADTVAQFQLWQEHTIKRTSTVLNLGNYECEVIGNIFDNAGLLESEG